MKTIHPEIRFKDLEQAELYMFTLDVKNSIPPKIIKNGQIVSNPEFETAPYAIKYIYHSPTREIISR